MHSQDERFLYNREKEKDKNHKIWGGGTEDVTYRISDEILAGALCFIENGVQLLPDLH